MITLYLDNCCYNRPFDETTQARVEAEKSAVLGLTRKPQGSSFRIIGSDALRYEILNNRDVGRREEILTYYRNSVIMEVSLTAAIVQRAEVLREASALKLLDSLHVASAEAGKADYLLTTDERMIRACRNVELQVRVLNPTIFWKEVYLNDPT